MFRSVGQGSDMDTKGTDRSSCIDHASAQSTGARALALWAACPGRRSRRVDDDRGEALVTVEARLADTQKGAERVSAERRQGARWWNRVDLS